jgi:hypothetical protein
MLIYFLFTHIQACGFGFFVVLEILEGGGVLESDLWVSVF